MLNIGTEAKYVMSRRGDSWIVWENRCGARVEHAGLRVWTASHYPPFSMHVGATGTDPWSHIVPALAAGAREIEGVTVLASPCFDYLVLGVPVRGSAPDGRIEVFRDSGRDPKGEMYLPTLFDHPLPKGSTIINASWLLPDEQGNWSAILVAHVPSEVVS